MLEDFTAEGEHFTDAELQHLQGHPSNFSQRDH